jgi:hypothetical protein
VGQKERGFCDIKSSGICIESLYSLRPLVPKGLWSRSLNLCPFSVYG